MIGFYNIIKPTGSSSAHVVSKVRRVTKQKRVGHLGTLDPAASGVLTVAVGKATRFFDYFLNKDKQYYAIAEFGVKTDTLDSDGEVLINCPTKINKKAILDKLKSFTGEVEQVPPIYSAININGKRAYEIARSGKDVQMPMRKVQIHSFKLVEQIDDNKFAFRVKCSSGTYIRSLLYDLALSLGTVANIPVIIREESGQFNINDAVTLEDIECDYENNLIPIENVFHYLKRVEINEKQYKKVINGVSAENIYSLNENEEFLGYINNKIFGLFVCNNNMISCKINLYEGE